MYSTILCPKVGLGIVIDGSSFVSFGWTPECLPQDEQKVLWMSDEASSSKRRVAWHESPQHMKKNKCGSAENIDWYSTENDPGLNPNKKWWNEVFLIFKPEAALFNFQLAGFRGSTCHDDHDFQTPSWGSRGDVRNLFLIEFEALKFNTVPKDGGRTNPRN